MTTNRRSNCCHLVLPALLMACGGSGGRTSPQTGTGLPAELVYCRARIGDEHRSSEIALRTVQNLGLDRVSNRTGRELHARMAPDGVRVVFSRERQVADPATRELFVATIDDSAGEQRLTINAEADDGPCWSPDSSRILWSKASGSERRLWIIGSDGRDPREFLAADPGTADQDPDWHRGTDRIAFARTGTDGRTQLWLVNGDGTGLLPLTLGTAAPGSGDFQPAFAPGGGSVAFVRRDAASQSRLMRVDVQTGAIAELFAPGGEVALPRWSPLGDRLFLAVSEPDRGRPGLRLCRILADGSDPLLLLPDERFLCEGIDVLPAIGPEPTAVTAVALDPEGAELQIAAGFRVLGSRAQLVAEDGQTLALATETLAGNEVAGINVVFDLPVTLPTDVVAIRVRAVAALSRTDLDPVLRLALHNPVERRFDTVTEIAPGGSGFHVLTFATASLAHVSRERQVRVEVIGEVGPGNRAELHVDHLEVTLVHRPQ